MDKGKVKKTGQELLFRIIYIPGFPKTEITGTWKRWSSCFICHVAHVSASSSPKKTKIRRRRKYMIAAKVADEISTWNHGRRPVMIWLLFLHSFLLISLWMNVENIVTIFSFRWWWSLERSFFVMPSILMWYIY